MVKNGVLILLMLCITACTGSTDDAYFFEEAQKNAEPANEAFTRSNNYLHAWLELRDSVSGLIPRNTKDMYWNAQDAAADNYAFMVLTASFTNEKVFRNEMREMLKAEAKLTSRIGHCPATYSFEKQGFLNDEPDTGNIIFGSSEYLKDGLMPLTEWLGDSPWRERMINILEDLYQYTGGKAISNIKGHYLGGVPEMETNGELLQVLTRMYWMSGNEDFINWAEKIGDYYLLNEENRIEKLDYLRLRDHGCEIVSGLTELYFSMNYIDKEKAKQYEEPLFSLFDRMLEISRNNHGLFYNTINPKTGEVIDTSLADTYGYTLNGFYTLWMASGKIKYREAVVKVLSNLSIYYTNHNWENNFGADGYADAIESALNLYNREPVEALDAWIDNEIKKMWAIQKESGIIEGWHGDGNFARTSIMYALWKTKGVYLSNWNSNVKIGAYMFDNEVFICVYSEKKWEGKIHCDVKRHLNYLNLPADYPRINQFPEWFTVNMDDSYQVAMNDSVFHLLGKELSAGINISLNENDTIKIKIYETNE